MGHMLQKIYFFVRLRVRASKDIYFVRAPYGPLYIFNCLSGFLLLRLQSNLLGSTAGLSSTEYLTE